MAYPNFMPPTQPTAFGVNPNQSFVAPQNPWAMNYSNMSPVNTFAQPAATPSVFSQGWDSFSQGVSDAFGGISNAIGGAFDDGGFMTFDKAFGKIDPKTGNMAGGWFAPMAQGLSAAGNLWLGNEQRKLAEKQLAASKEAFDKNWNAQKLTTNTALVDRQNARHAANPSAYASGSSEEWRKNNLIQ